MKIWRLPSRTLSLEKPLVMGVINLTPDSFSDGGKFSEPVAAFDRAKQLIEEGADILDLGAESTKPGARSISSEMQIARLLPALEKIKKLSISISIDTTHVDVAEACLQAGADVINDVSGLRESAGKVALVAAKYKAGLILMHRRGNAETMQKLAVYEDLLAEVCDELEQSYQRAMECGVASDAIILDPGLGFSKTPDQNFFLIKEIKRFEKLQRPLLLGPSRKLFIGKATGREVDEREFGTVTCIAYAFQQGIRFFRVHDVKAARDALKMLEAINSANFQPNARLGCF